MVRRILAATLLAVCVAAVVVYQISRPAKVSADPAVFVPSPAFFEKLSPGFRTSIADAYYLATVQYYGEHLKSDQRFDSLPAMVDLVTTLSPHFKRAFFFGAFALIDAGRPDVAYRILERGFRENRNDWHFPAYLGFFAYTYGAAKDRDALAAEWYGKAAAIPGRPDYLPRIAAALLAKGGQTEKAIIMWGQVYTAGDKYSQRRAVNELDKLLPNDKQARMKAVAPLYDTMPIADFEALIAELFKGYE